MKAVDTPSSSRTRRRVLSRLLGYGWRYQNLWWKALILLLIATAADVSGPILIKVFIDDYLTPQQFPALTLSLLAGGYILLYLINALTSYRQNLLFSEIALRVIESLRNDLFHHVLRLPVSFFDRSPTGNLISRITNDTETIKDLYVNVISKVIQNGIMILGIFIAMAVLDVRLMLICLVLVPLAVTAMLIYQRLSAPLFHRARSLLGDINAQLNESLQGMALIQIMNQQKRFVQRFEKTVGDHYRARVANVKLDGLMLRALVDLLNVLTLAGILLLFGFRSLEQVVEIGVIYAFINYLARFAEPLIEMTQRLNLLQQALVSGERVFTLMEQPLESYPNNDAIELSRGEIHFDQVRFSYDGKQEVLKGIDLHVRPGQFQAVVGHTGSGKSTLINLLMRFYPLSQGQIRIDGIPLSQIPADRLRRHIGIVQQDAFIFSGTLTDNIAMGAPLSQAEIEEAARQANLHDYIQSLPQGYQTELDERGSNLSTGQRQLLSLARTLARKPCILILDEATANIDSETESHIMASLRKLRGKVTILAIAHRLSTITDADNILVLYRGEIAQQGSHQQLLRTEGLYRHIYQLQEQQGLETGELATDEASRSPGPE